jgi:hypothetical protein
MFTLTAQVLGNEQMTSARRDAAGAIVVTTASGPLGAASVRDAIRIARRDMGEFLLPAQRPGRPWGLRVEVSGVAAVYGDWPGFRGPRIRERERELVTRIRADWHDSGPDLGPQQRARDRPGLPWAERPRGRVSGGKTRL